MKKNRKEALEMLVYKAKNNRKSGIFVTHSTENLQEACKVVERKGSWYSKGDLRFAQGRRPAVEFLKSNPNVAQEVEDEVRIAMATRMSPGGVMMDEEVGEEEEVEEIVKFIENY